MPDGHCPETTHRLNCSCCDEIRLYCHLPEGHPGPHVGGVDDWDHLNVTWSYEDGWRSDGHTLAVPDARS